MDKLTIEFGILDNVKCMTFEDVKTNKKVGRESLFIE